MHLERQILDEHQLDLQQHHFNEGVAQVLWNQWNCTKSLEDRDRFLLLLYPLITKLLGPYIRFIENDAYGPQYEDLWQECIIKSIEIMPKYSPTRLNKQGRTSKIFSYWTYILQYHLLHLTQNEYKVYKNRQSELGEEVQSSDSAQAYADFKLYCLAFSERRNLRETHRAMYRYLSRIPEEDMASVCLNLVPHLAEVTGTTSKDIENGLRLLRKAAGRPQINSEVSYRPPTTRTP